MRQVALWLVLPGGNVGSSSSIGFVGAVASPVSCLTTAGALALRHNPALRPLLGARSVPMLLKPVRLGFALAAFAALSLSAFAALGRLHLVSDAGGQRSLFDESSVQLFLV